MQFTKLDRTFLMLTVFLAAVALLFFGFMFYESGEGAADGSGMGYLDIAFFYAGGHILFTIALWLSGLLLITKKPCSNDGSLGLCWD